MTDIRWPLSTSPGERAQEDAGRLINCYAEPRDENSVIYHRMPGASIFGEEEVDTSWRFWSLWEYFIGAAEARPELHGVFRGGVIVGDTLTAVLGERIYQFSRNGDVDETGTLPGTAWVFMARNNAAVPDIVAVTDSLAYEIVNGAALAYSDPDVGSPASVASHEGYFFFNYGSGLIRSSDLNSTNINTLNRAAAESNPDGLLHGWSFEGYYYAAGPTTIEVFGPPVNDAGFPYNRIGNHITPGILCARAVAGFEPGFGHPVHYVAQNRTVRRLIGTTAEHISPPQLDRLIAAIENPETELDTLCYVVEGVAWFQVNGPTWSWAFNLNTEKWSEMRSQGLARSRRTGSVYAFEKWLVGDTQAGQLLVVDNSEEEADDPWVFWMESLDVEGFPARTRVDVADFLFSVGVGRATGRDPIEVSPTCRIQYSDDGGEHWSTSYTRDLGRQKVTSKRVTLNNTGLTQVQGRRWRILVSDPVHVGFHKATQMQKVYAERRRVA